MYRYSVTSSWLAGRVGGPIRRDVKGVGAQWRSSTAAMIESAVEIQYTSHYWE